jgi:hypothetical protein
MMAVVGSDTAIRDEHRLLTPKDIMSVPYVNVYENRGESGKIQAVRDCAVSLAQSSLHLHIGEQRCSQVRRKQKRFGLFPSLVVQGEVWIQHAQDVKVLICAVV